MQERRRRVLRMSNPPEYAMDEEGYRCVRCDLVNMWCDRIIVQDRNNKQNKKKSKIQ